tara:strand:- start:644 stop:1819 length:1176 start_codon:yes stop_codon:yes gene_type:complete
VIKKLTLIFLLLTTFATQAQYVDLSETSEVSILTIGPGDQLYDKFGHSAFRIKDTAKDIDLIFNYGRYDFNTPNFYTKFARGKLLYELGVSDYTSFLNSYRRQQRWVKEQVLDLDYSEKQAIFHYLLKNAEPENKKYLYDFFYDNCATRIRDVLQENLGDKLSFNNELTTQDFTFRELIQKNVHYNTWGSLGMDVAIGAVVDRKAEPLEYQFLPEYVYEATENATINKNGKTSPLVKETSTLYNGPGRSLESNFLTGPLFVFGIIALMIIYFTYRDHKRNKRSRLLDAIIFFVTGIIGIILLFLWFGTDHSATLSNYNLLWAVPLSLFFAPLIFKKEPKKWLRRYVIFLILLLTLLTIHWFTGVQEFAIGFLPLFIALAIRYIYLVRVLRK